MIEEKRERTRVPLKFDAFLDINGEEVPVKTEDLSMRGMRCSPNHGFKQDDNCTIVFVLNSEVKFRIEGKIMRTDQDGTGIHFSGMDEESFHHLKRLVQYNSDDPEKIDNEIIRLKKNQFLSEVCR